MTEMRYQALKLRKTKFWNNGISGHEHIFRIFEIWDYNDKISSLLKNIVPVESGQS